MKTCYGFSLWRKLGSFLVLTMLTQLSLNAQPVPAPNFDWCNGVPTSTSHFSTLNNYLAYANAPMLYQQLETDYYFYDIPVLVGFDGNLISSDNWQNAYDLRNSIPTPTVYYTVLWTQSYFIITYSFFYPRNWNNCNEAFDEHNNDLERVAIIIDRCTNESAIMASHHGASSKRRCSKEKDIIFNDKGGPILVPNDDIDPMITSGTHPVVYISWGSHASWLNIESAIDDGLNWVNPCHANRLGTCWRFLGPNPGATPVIGCADGYYRLVDVFAPGGLWDVRDAPGLFIGDNFDCGGVPCGVSTPWNGDLGRNPFNYFVDQVGKICGNDITEETFIYNPYQCGSYTIKADVTYGCEGAEFAVGITADSGNPITDASVTWHLYDDLECEGCDDKLTNVTMTSQVEGAVVIGATIETNDCGVVEMAPLVLSINPPTPLPSFWDDIPVRVCAGELTHVSPINTVGWSNLNLTLCEGEGFVNFSNSIDVGNLLIEAPDEGSFTICWSGTNSCGDMVDGSFVVRTVECDGSGGPQMASNPNHLNELTVSKPAEVTTAEEDQLSEINGLLQKDNRPATASEALIFPNPFQESFTLNYRTPEESNFEWIRIIDVSGKTVFESRETLPVGGMNRSKEINLQDLPGGVYYLNIQFGNEMIYKKIVKIAP